MQDIADQLEISKNAVSLALNGKPGVSDETRDSVLQLAQKMNYQPALVNKASKKILVLIPEYIRNDSFFYNNIYWSIENHAASRGYTAILTTISQHMQENNQLPQIYNEMKFIGIITVGILPLSYMRFLQEKSAHIVSVDHTYNELNLDSIVTDNIVGSYNITKYVIQQGHIQIGYVGSIQVTSSLFERWCGYMGAMMDAGLPLQPELSIVESSPLTSLLSSKNELLAILRNMDHFPTAWICGGDRMAISLIEALTTLGIRVPDDISVAGFDNIEAASIVTPPLTTVDVKRSELGKLSVDRLLVITEQARYTPCRLAIHANIVERSSVSPLLHD